MLTGVDQRPLPTARMWLAAAAPVLVLAAVTLPTAKPGAPAAAATLAGAGLAVTLILLGLGVVLARRHAAPGYRGPLLVATATIVLMIVANALPELPALARLDGSWQAKLLNICWLAILLASWPAGRHAAGLTPRLAPGSVRPVLLAAGAACLAWLALGMLAAWAGLLQPPSTSLFWFELLLPGIDEELVFRGIALGMLLAAFGTPGRFLGAPAGWGLVIVTIVFAALHAFARSDGHLSINILAAVLSAPIGLLLAWIRLRSGSIWPAVLAHNAINTAHLLGATLV